MQLQAPYKDNHNNTTHVYLEHWLYGLMIAVIYKIYFSTLHLQLQINTCKFIYVYLEHWLYGVMVAVFDISGNSLGSPADQQMEPTVLIGFHYLTNMSSFITISQRFSLHFII